MTLNKDSLNAHISTYNNLFINEILEYSVPESEQFSASYYDTELLLTEFERDIKVINAYKYHTEYVPDIPKYEKFRTLYRRL